MCVPGCRRGGPARDVAPRIFRRRRGRGAFSQRRRRRRTRSFTLGRRPDPYAVAGVPDLLRHARHRARHAATPSSRTARTSTGGTCWSMPAPMWMRRSTIRTQARRRTRSRPSSWWCRSRSSTSPPRPRATPTIALTPPGPRRLGGKARPPAGQLLRRDAFRLGAARNERAKYTGKDAAGTMHFPGIASAGRRMADQGAPHRRASRSIRSRSITARRRISGRTSSGCRPGAGGSRTSPISTRCRPSGATIVVGLPKVKDATGGPARILALV